MAQANLPISYWGDALLVATYILNRVPSKSVPSTPYERWTGRKPDLSNLRPWGSAAYVHDKTHKYGKLGPRGRKCIFIRYSETSKGYVFIGEQQDGGFSEIESRDATFIETEFPTRGEIDKTIPLFEEKDTVPLSTNQESQEIPESSQSSGRNLPSHELTSHQSNLRKSVRKIKPRKWFDDEALMTLPIDDDEPRTVEEALRCSVRENWKIAMDEEMESMRKNQVWDLVDLPLGRRAIGNKWTPTAKGTVLSKSMCPKTPEEIADMKKKPYASAIGSLMYTMLCTRPDISYAVGLVSRFQSNPGSRHWKAVKRIFRYLKGTANYCLCFHGADMSLSGYTDADWAGDLDDRKSTSGYTFLLNGGAISWNSKKQACVALSTMEAEYVACAAAVQEAVWLRRFLKHLKITEDSGSPVTVYCDSQAAIAFSKDPKYHSKDPFTKPLTKESFQGHVKSLGLRRM
ncbi:uncharacterized protein LOC141826187 [Curcuma longa]|uniref:uncharacterized protein LOC141826187 n=1 Tax=Curcuma longa TaxID=136217 RepID=UPI003D9F4816